MRHELVEQGQEQPFRTAEPPWEPGAAPNIGDAWPVWIVADGCPVKVRQIDAHCTIEDVLDACEYRDMIADVGAYRNRQLRGQVRE